MPYYSEYAQDQWLEENVFKGRRDGTFIEIGALDGILHSNTLFFERERGWTGYLVEANPDQFLKLLSAKRNALPVLAAVGKPGLNKFSVVPGCVGWSGIKESMEPQHKERVKALNPNTVDFLVATVSIDELLQRFTRLDHIDYLSIDVEGAEFDVVAHSFELSHSNIEVVGIENNYQTDCVEKAMATMGYKKFHRQGVDDFYRRG
jgi:FkbM family methyltransferase